MFFDFPNYYIFGLLQTEAVVTANPATHPRPNSSGIHHSGWRRHACSGNSSRTACITETCGSAIGRSRGCCGRRGLVYRGGRCRERLRQFGQRCAHGPRQSWRRTTMWCSSCVLKASLSNGDASSRKWCWDSHASNFCRDGIHRNHLGRLSCFAVLEASIKQAAIGCTSFRSLPMIHLRAAHHAECCWQSPSPGGRGTGRGLDTVVPRSHFSTTEFC